MVGIVIIVRPLASVAALALVIALWAAVAFANPPATLSTLMALLAAFGIAGGAVLIIAPIRLRAVYEHDSPAALAAVLGAAATFGTLAVEARLLHEQAETRSERS